MSFLMNFIAILVLFITANMAIVYSRDQLLSFRPSSDLHSHLTVSQLRLHRRSCRAGAHWRRRVLAARGMTSQCNITRTCVGIPTINGHHTVVINNEQLNAHVSEQIVPLWTTSLRGQRTVSPLTPAVTKERNIPVIIGRRRHSKRSCWQPRKNASSNLIKINKQDTATPDTATYTNVHDATGGRVLPTIYLLNPTSLAKPHAIQQLTTDVLTYDADTVVITESWLKQRHTIAAFTIPGFDIFRRDRTRRRSHSVCPNCNWSVCL